jgi:hypothetical protein
MSTAQIIGRKKRVEPPSLTAPPSTKDLHRGNRKALASTENENPFLACEEDRPGLYAVLSFSYIETRFYCQDKRPHKL